MYSSGTRYIVVMYYETTKFLFSAHSLAPSIICPLITILRVLTVTIIAFQFIPVGIVVGYALL